MWRHDRRGLRMLDETDGHTRLHSLRRDGRKLTWRRGAELRTATIK